VARVIVERIEQPVGSVHRQCALPFIDGYVQGICRAVMAVARGHEQEGDIEDRTSTYRFAHGATLSNCTTKAAAILCRSS
jgi:hypothetical protein